MKTVSKPLALILILALALAGAACDTPTGPTVVNVVNNNTLTNNNGQSGSDPSEPNKTTGSVKSGTKSVTVNGFKDGEKCPSSITPANQNQKIRLGCDLAVTCNPRDAEGKVIQDDKAPPVDYFILATGQDVVTFAQWASNTYNADVKTVKAGKFQLICSVVGISSGLQDFEVIP